MAEKILNTRIQLKHDTLANWQSKNTLLKKGEIAIAVIEAVDPANKLHQPVMFKVGPGNFNDLEWASALAADVYAWAKKPSLDPNDLPEIPGLKLGISFEIVGEGNAITNVDYDTTNKKFTFTKGETFATKKELEDVVANGTVVAEGAKIDVAQNGNTYTVSHETVEDPTETAGSGRKYLTGVTTDGYGHITGYTTASESDQDLSGYKTTQEAFEKNGAVSKTITAVTQDANGEIDVTYSDIAITSTQVTDLADLLAGKETAGAAGEALENAKTYVNDKFTEANLAQYTTEQEVKDIVDTVVAAAVEGDALEGLTDLVEYINAHGGEAAEMAKAIEALEAKPGLDKVGTVTSITAGDGLDGDEITTSGTISLNATTKSSLAKADTALQAADIVGKADKVSGAVNGNFAGLDANGNLTDSGKKASDFATADQGTLADSAVQSVSLASGANNGTVKLTVDGVDTDNIAVTGLGTAAYKADTAFDAAGTAANEVNNALENRILTGDGLDATYEEGNRIIFIPQQGITGDLVANHTIGAAHLKAEQGYTGSDAEVWVFDCGGAE